MACAMVTILTFTYQMYLTEAMLFPSPQQQLPPDFIQQAFDYQKMVTVVLILTWCSIASVKFSFLFLFKRLIDRIRPLIVYWWVVTAFNVAVALYGAVIYVVACPWFYSIKSGTCRPSNLPTRRQRPC